MTSIFDNLSELEWEEVGEHFGYYTSDGYLLNEDKQIVYLKISEDVNFDLITECVYLEKLEMMHANLTEIPESIGSLKNLQLLSLHGNNLVELPESLGELINLKELFLGQNNLIKLPKSISSLKNLEGLYLHNNALTELPEDLTKLINLNVLTLSNNNLAKLPENITNLINLTRLSLSSNNLTELPKSISNLTSLKDLDLSSNNLTELPKSISNLTSLQRLNLSSNNLIEINNVTSLEELDLSSNNLTEFPKSISNLTSLKELNLSSNNLTELPERISNLTSLQRLNLSSNNLTEFHESINNLTSLEELNLSSNNLTEFPERISNLTSLEELNLSSNNLTGISESINNLTSLHRLYLSSNNLTGLPESISNLIHLQDLDLSSNNLTGLPESISNLIHLQGLDLSSNNLTELPESIINLSNLEWFVLERNPIINNLTETEKLAPQELITYLLSIQNKETKPLKEAKILVVGDERVGKTSIINRITGQPYDRNQDSTEGIDIQNFLLSNNYKVNIWDFAGQEITHQTHQFFLTSRSLYLYVIDAQKEDNDSGIFHWLNVIKTNSNNSPIIIVVNKRDLNLGYNFNINRYQEDFNIVDVVYVSSEDKEKINEEIVEKIEHNTNDLIKKVEQNVEKLKGVNDLIPTEWFNVKEELEKLNNENIDFIEFNGYEKICEKYNIYNYTSQNTLLGILNIVGTIVTYINNDRLQNMQIINPSWVTNGVYKVIRSHLIKKDAILNKRDFQEIFKNDDRYNKRHYPWIIDLLNQFEISFLYENDKILIPSKLDSNQPNFDLSYHQSGLNFLYEYKGILKKSVISQFIVKMNTYIDTKKETPYWQRGVFLNYYSSKAVVISDEDKKTISISINTNKKEGRDLLAIIRHILREINKFKLQADELVPLVLEGEIVGHANYDFLIDAEKDGDSDIRLQIERDGKITSHRFNINELLDGYRLEEQNGFNYLKLRNDLIEIAQIETENRQKIFSEKEDDINDRFRSGLLNRKYYINDQSRGGESENSKSSGERDIVIRNEKKGITESIIEALQLDCLDKTNIDKHYNKLHGKYDTVGNKENYMLIYSKAKDFNILWNKYKKHYDGFYETSEKESMKENVKVGFTKHKKMVIYHIFINFYSQ